MLFFNSNPNDISLRLSISSLGQDNSVAFGPGSIINGSVYLKTEGPIQIQQLVILFQCQVIRKEHQQQHHQMPTTTTLFSVKEYVSFDNTDTIHDNTTIMLPAGSHMNLFAIQLPLVNYPPTITDTSFHGDHYTINYTIQALLERPGEPTIFSPVTPIMYLPLVEATTSETAVLTNNIEHQSASTTNDSSIVEMEAYTMQPTYCPGDECTIQLKITNKTDQNISQVYVTFVTQLITDRQQLEQVLYHQSVSVSIPRHATDHMEMISLPIARHCLPSFRYDCHGIKFHLEHTIIISLSPLQQRHKHTISDQPSFSSFTTTRLLSSLTSFYNKGDNHASSSIPTSATPLFIPITIITAPRPKTILREKEKVPIPPSTGQHTTQLQHAVSTNNLPIFLQVPASPCQAPFTYDDDKYSVSPSSSFCLNGDNDDLDENAHSDQ